MILVVAGGCSRNERTTSSTALDDSATESAPHAAEASSTVVETAATSPQLLWREIVAQREALGTHLEAREWADVKERAGHLRDLVAVYAGRFDRATPMVAAQMDALVQAVDAATQDLIAQCDRQDLAGARRQRDRIRSILAQIGALAKEA